MKMAMASKVMEADEGYDTLEKQVKSNLAGATGTLFKMHTPGLADTFLNNLPSNRQHYNCNCCRKFLEDYGCIARIDSAGNVRSVTFPDTQEPPHFFKKPVNKLREYVEGARVAGVFLSGEVMLGTPQSKSGWTHLHSANPRVFKHTLLTADQKAAEYQQDYELMERTIQEYTLKQVETAVQILKSGHLPSEQKSISIAQWYLELLQSLRGVRGKQRERIMWYNVATAPPGFVHLKNGMVGTLLNDLKTGVDFKEVVRNWSEKMKPTNYQRPKAAPSEGQIDAAERVVKKLGVDRSLKRRFAFLHEVPNIVWRPEPKTGLKGTFSELRKPILPPAQSMTWYKFQKDVLPLAARIEIYVHWKGSFVALTTANDPDAPLIFQWDNPVSYYTYANQTDASRWGLGIGYSEVTSITQPPYGDQCPHLRKFALFIIEGAQDRQNQGLGLFPEMLRSEFREIRHTIEAHSNNGKIAGGGNASGLPFDERNPVTIRVNGAVLYKLDRWE